MTTCEYMDEVGVHTDTQHDPHPPAANYGLRVDYEDGDIVRHGYECVICHHVTDGAGLFHTDSRLDGGA